MRVSIFIPGSLASVDSGEIFKYLRICMSVSVLTDVPVFHHPPVNVASARMIQKLRSWNFTFRFFFEDEVTKFEQTRKGKNFQLFKAKMP